MHMNSINTFSVLTEFLIHNRKLKICFTFIVDQDLSHMDQDEAYDYKFVKWMIKEKVHYYQTSALVPRIGFIKLTCFDFYSC